MAGGIGNRVGAGIPKQFVEVLGKPVIAYTMQKLQQCSDIDAIELVCVDSFQYGWMFLPRMIIFVTRVMIILIC